MSAINPPWRIAGFMLLLGLGLRAGHGQAVIEQTASYDQDVPLLLSWGHAVDVGLMPVEREGIGRRRLAFVLLVANKTGQPFDVSAYNVSVTTNDQHATLVTAETLAREARRRGAWAKAGVALAGGLNAGFAGSNAGQYSESGRFRGSIGDSKSSTSFSGNYQLQGYDGAASDQVRQREMDRATTALNRLDGMQDARLSSIQNSVLMRTTVRPGEELSRTIVVEHAGRLRPGDRLTVKALLAGEPHELELRRTGAGWDARPRRLPLASPATAVPHSAGPAAPIEREAPSPAVAVSASPSTPATVPTARSSPVGEEIQPQEGLADLAMRTELSSNVSVPEAQIRAHLDAFRIEPGTAADGTMTVSNVLFNVRWSISTRDGRLPRRVLGDLVFGDDSDSKVRIFWPLPAQGERLPDWTFTDLDTGFILEGQLAVEAWIRSMSDINRVVRYEIQRIDY